jgi:hypothetical protein
MGGAGGASKGFIIAQRIRVRSTCQKLKFLVKNSLYFVKKPLVSLSKTPLKVSKTSEKPVKNPFLTSKSRGVPVKGDFLTTAVTPFVPPYLADHHVLLGLPKRDVCPGLNETYVQR